MKNKDLPNRLTNIRLVLSLIIIFILLFPFNMLDISFKKYLINSTIILDLKMAIVGVLFIIACITDFLDGFLARKYNNISDYGTLMDPIADKILVNCTLVILSAYGYIHPIAPVIVIMRDIIVNSLRMVAAVSGIAEPAGMTGKVKTLFLMIGITLQLFGNLPFGLINLEADDFFIVAGVILCVISGFEYNKVYKKYLKK